MVFTKTWLHRTAKVLLLTFSLFPVAAHASQARDDDDDDDARPSAAPAEIVITGRRLDTAREAVEPSLGASTYALSNEAVEVRPSGETDSIAQILLQAPGVVQAGNGRIAVRGSQGGVQYRINNVILPDGIADIGEHLSPRLADQVTLITGALPAQYGLQVGGVVSIKTKNGLYGNGGQLELYGGNHGRIEPAIEYAGSSDSTSYFVTGSYLHDNIGLGSPDGTSNPAHDRTNQLDGLAFIDHVIDDTSRISLIAGASSERFEIPEGPGLSATGTPLVANPINGGYARQDSQYGALSYLLSQGPATLQLSVFGRHTKSRLRPSASAGLSATGMGGETASTDLAGGVQIEGAYSLGAHHNLRAGGVLSFQSLRSHLNAVVLPTGLVPQVPTQIANFSKGHRTEASFFVQDEWKPLDHVSINVGGRFDTVSGFAEATAFEPRVSVVWSAPSGMTLHAGYSRYLVAPSIYLAGQAQALAGTSGLATSLPVGRPRPERDDYYDVGVQQKLGDLTIDVDAFWRNAQNQLSERQEGSPLLAEPFNYREGRVRGVEVSMTYSEGPVATWANFSYLDAKARGIATGYAYIPAAVVSYSQNHWMRPDGSQPYSASAGVSYKFGPMHVAADMLYGSGGQRSATISNPSPGHLPGYVQVDFAAVYRMDGIRDRPLDIRVDLINAFDRRYEISTDSSEGIPQWGPRRGIFVGVEQAF